MSSKLSPQKNASCDHLYFILPETAYLSSTDTEFDPSVLLGEGKVGKAVKHTLYSCSSNLCQLF